MNKNTTQRLADPMAGAPLDWTYKGLPVAAEGVAGEGLGALGLNLLDDSLLFPVAVLREEVMKANSRWMMSFLARHGVDLAPHGKTTMSPQLMDLQLRDGCWGLTAATVHHVRAYRQWGARRIILANQLVGGGEIGWIAREMASDPQFDFYCLVDSIDGARQLAKAMAQHAPGRPIRVLAEVGVAGGRTGVRSLLEGQALVDVVATLPGLALCGVETFEGLFQTDPEGRGRAEGMLGTVVDLATYADRHGAFADDEILITGGGSGLFDIAAGMLSAHGLSRPVRVVIRSGCYLIHDDGMYKALFAQVRDRAGDLAGPGLRPALEVWARVLSKPEPGRMICGLGKRDIGEDCGPPQLVGWVPAGTGTMIAPPTECRVVGLNDQHAYVDGPNQEVGIGDLLAFGVSHPCTTLDKWRGLLTVDPEHRVTGMVRTYF